MRPPLRVGLPFHWVILFSARFYSLFLYGNLLLAVEWREIEFETDPASYVEYFDPH